MWNRLLVVASLSVVAVTGANAAQGITSPTFGDIQTWYGTGENQAGLLIDWNDGKSPDYQLYGIQWGSNDPTPTVQTLLNLMAATPGSGFYVNYANHGGLVVFGLGQDTHGNGFTYVPGANNDVNEDGHAADSADHYAEGWYANGYWAQYISDNAAGDWNYAALGIATPLSNGTWDGWSFNPASMGWDAGLPSVPEPASLGLLVLGALGLLARRK